MLCSLSVIAPTGPTLQDSLTSDTNIYIANSLVSFISLLKYLLDDTHYEKKLRHLIHSLTLLCFKLLYPVPLLKKLSKPLPPYNIQYNVFI